MKIGVCTLAMGDKFKQSTYFGRLTKAIYCAKHDYDLLDDEGTDIYDGTRPMPWSKVKLLQKHLADYDYLVWLDGDTIIMNDSVSLESLISSYMQDKEFMLCIDNGMILNTGVWFVKNTPYTHRFLKSMYDRTDLIDARFWEQAAFIDFYNTNEFDVQNHSMVLPQHMQTVFNCSMYFYKPGCLLIHFLGFCGQPDLLAVAMRKFYPGVHIGESDIQYAERMKGIAEHPEHQMNVFCV
jgi:hypothetical protein